MRGPEKLKKTESIELRLPHTLKQAFMARCRASGASASAALRGFIVDYVEGRVVARAEPARSLRAPLRWALVAGALLAVGALAEPSLARPSLPAAFARIDADHDGRISFGEFSNAATLELALGAEPATPLARARPGTLSADLQGRLLRDAFDRIDANRDGEISYAEFRRYYGEAPR
jgi:hypothetical protein